MCLNLSQHVLTGLEISQCVSTCFKRVYICLNLSQHVSKGSKQVSIVLNGYQQEGINGSHQVSTGLGESQRVYICLNLSQHVSKGSKQVSVVLNGYRQEGLNGSHQVSTGLGESQRVSTMVYQHVEKISMSAHISRLPSPNH